MSKKKTPPEQTPKFCGSCGDVLSNETKEICLLCQLLGPARSEYEGPPAPPNWGQLVDLNQYRESRGLPVYLGEEVDTPHHYAGDAHLKDAYGNPLFSECD